MYGAKNQATEPTPDGRADECDPYDIVPDYFCEAWGEDTIPAALEAAERAKSTTPREEMARCPECGTPNIGTKDDHRETDNKIDTEYRCRRTGCRAHFDEPDPPPAEADE